MSKQKNWPFGAAEQVIVCRANGVYFADYSLRSVSITNQKANAMRFTQEEKIAVAINFLRGEFGAFDWTAVAA